MFDAKRPSPQTRMSAAAQVSANKQPCFRLNFDDLPVSLDVCLLSYFYKCAGVDKAIFTRRDAVWDPSTAIISCIRTDFCNAEEEVSQSPVGFDSSLHLPRGSICTACARKLQAKPTATLGYHQLLCTIDMHCKDDNSSRLKRLVGHATKSNREAAVSPVPPHGYALGRYMRTCTAAN